MTATAEREGSLLLRWLNLLGWQVELDWDGELICGVAATVADDGSLFRVGGCGRTVSELSLQLFEGAMRAREIGDSRLPASELAVGAAA